LCLELTAIQIEYSIVYDEFQNVGAANTIDAKPDEKVPNDADAVGRHTPAEKKALKIKEKYEGLNGELWLWE
jgi:hypothetical protein